MWSRLAELPPGKLTPDGWIRARDLYRTVHQQSWLKQAPTSTRMPLFRSALDVLRQKEAVEIRQGRRVDTVEVRLLAAPPQDVISLDQERPGADSGIGLGRIGLVIGLLGDGSTVETVRDYERATVRDGFVYVLEFSDMTIKIGQSASVSSRLRTHARESGRFGVSISRWWVSPRIVGYKECEHVLIQEAARRGLRRAGREYFTGLGFDDLVDLASTVASD